MVTQRQKVCKETPERIGKHRPRGWFKATQRMVKQRQEGDVVKQRQRSGKQRQRLWCKQVW